MGVSLIVLTPAVAAAVAGPNLKPRPIAAGPHAGGFAVSRAALDDPLHAGVRPTLAAALTVALDPALAWPDDD